MSSNPKCLISSLLSFKDASKIKEYDFHNLRADGQENICSTDIRNSWEIEKIIFYLPPPLHSKESESLPSSFPIITIYKIIILYTNIYTNNYTLYKIMLEVMHPIMGQKVIKSLEKKTDHSEGISINVAVLWRVSSSNGGQGLVIKIAPLHILSRKKINREC